MCDDRGDMAWVERGLLGVVGMVVSTFPCLPRGERGMLTCWLGGVGCGGGGGGGCGGGGGGCGG